MTFYDTSAGTVAITSNPGDDQTYAAGDVIDLTVTFTESVMVDTTDGIPKIGLTIGTIQKLAGSRPAGLVRCKHCRILGVNLRAPFTIAGRDPVGDLLFKDRLVEVAGVDHVVG